MNSWKSSHLLLGAFLFCAASAPGQTPPILIENPDIGHDGSSFGVSVAVENRIMAYGIGTGSFGEVGSHGIVQVWRADANDEWQFLTEFAPDSPQTGAAFGNAVDLDGLNMVVGSPSYSDGGVAGGAAYIFKRGGTDFSEVAQFTLPSPNEADDFGFAVAIDGDYAVVGAPGRSEGGISSGSATVFQLNGANWIPVQTLVPDTPAAGDLFGSAVAIEGDMILVGAPGYDGPATDSGAVAVFTLSGGNWISQGNLAATSLADEDAFGTSVALTASGIAAGAPGYSGTEAESGAVFTYQRTATGGTNERVLTDPNPVADDSFGRSLDLVGNNLLVGLGTNSQHKAHLYGLTPSGWDFVTSFDPTFNNPDFAGSVALGSGFSAIGCSSCFTRGSVYTYLENGGLWTASDIFEQDGRASNDDFGSAVAVSGNTIAVGAEMDAFLGSEKGSVHIFVVDGQQVTLQQTVRDSIAPFLAEFGAAVALNGDRLLVGAPSSRVGSAMTGEAFVFERSGDVWSETAVFESANPQVNYRFGEAVALGETLAVVGEPQAAQGADLNAGAAYLFVDDGTDWSLPIVIADPSPTADGNFGHSVAIDGETIVVGSPGIGLVGERGSATVYTYDGSGAVLVQELVPNAATTGAQFGSSVAIKGDTILVGASLNHDVGDGVKGGAVYVFELDNGTWVERTILTGNPNNRNNSFGATLSFDGTNAIVGAPLENAATGEDSGTAFLFRRTTAGWVQLEFLAPPSPSDGELFGDTVAVDSGKVVIGAPIRSESENRSGAAFLYLPDLVDPAPIPGWKVY